MNKKALVLTYHVSNCTRKGGFHFFINFLSSDGFDIDWVTVPVSIMWLFRKNDKENPKNFVDLCRGTEFLYGNSHIRHFSSPVWIPAKVAQKLKMNLGTHYWPKWSKLRRKMHNNYDLILVEGTACQYAKELRRDYPNAKILYRPSDILSMFSNVPNPVEIENTMINVADKTLCVDETMMSYYISHGADSTKLEILRNPITTTKDIELIKTHKINKESEQLVVYIGVSCIDTDIVEYAAKNNPKASFIMIGPINKVSHDNIIYTGILTEKEYTSYLEKACIGINPLSSNLVKCENGIAVGYTRKIISYMKYLMPIVATCSTNYLGVDGFFCVNSKEEFSDKISELLKYSVDDREKLRMGYLNVLKVFSEQQAKYVFLSYAKTE